VKSYKVRFWAIKTNKRKNPKTGKTRVVSHTVRWVVDGRECSQTHANKPQAESFLSDLRQAAKNGEPFDTETGLPDSMIEPPKAEETPSVTWFEHACEYVDWLWARSAAQGRRSVAESLMAVTPVLVSSSEGAPEADLIRRALKQWAFNTGRRRETPPADVERALAWMRGVSLPVSAMAEGEWVGAALKACASTLDGKKAASEYYRRRRRVFYGALKYAVRKERLSTNPLDGADEPEWKTPEVSPAIDRRRVASPRQMRGLIAAIPHVGRTQGPRLAALYGCMYYGMLRPSEAVSLRHEDCDLPDEGWGWLDFAEVRSAAGADWTDDGLVHETRGLKGRPDKTRRRVPIPPAQVRLLKDHVEKFGVAEDGRLFRSYRGGVVHPSTLWRVLQAARVKAFTPAQVASPLMAKPYDCRHAGVSMRLNAGVPVTYVAEWAGHSVEMLQRVYAHCYDGEDDRWYKRIDTELSG
jgi:integrase